MSRRIVINRLVQDELQYELTIRGIAAGTVAEMRKNLAMAFQLESEDDSVVRPDYPFTVDQDLAAVVAKLAQVEPEVASFLESRVSGKFQKLQSQLAHVLGRLDNITTFDEGEEGDVQRSKRAELLAKSLSLLDDLTTKAENYERSWSSQPPVLDILEQPGVSFANLSQNRRSTLRQDVPTTPPRHHMSTTNSNFKSIAPSKWGLRFAGDHKGLSLSSFLEKVEEYRISRNVSKEMLLSSGVDLFSGRAYQFYLAYREEVNSWDDFVALLREEFLTVDYNEKLFDEIKKRTQGPDESMGIYLAVMAGYFKRLTCSISEETKLKILLRNIAPYYQNHLGLVDIKSISELLTLGRKLEARKAAIENYSVPSRKANCLEPDLAYVSVSVDPVDAVEGPRPVSNDLCFRCNQPGHRAVGCLRPSVGKFCYRCKKEGFTVRTCPNCSASKTKKGNDSRRS